MSKRYSDYCTCYYLPEIGCVVFYDEIAEKELSKQPAVNKDEATALMLKWKREAPQNFICDILE